MKTVLTRLNPFEERRNAIDIWKQYSQINIEESKNLLDTPKELIL